MTGRTKNAARSAATPRGQRSCARTVRSVRTGSAITSRTLTFAADALRKMDPTGVDISCNLPRIFVGTTAYKTDSPVDGIPERDHEMLAEPDLVDVDEDEIQVSSVLWGVPF